MVEHAAEISAANPPIIRPQMAEETSQAYSAYLEGVRSVHPYAEEHDGKFFLSWGGEEVEYAPDQEVIAICQFVGQECRAASIFFETGATPGGIPWDQQPWWRVKIWFAMNLGRSEKDSDSVDRPTRRPEAPKPEKLVWRGEDGNVVTDLPPFLMGQQES
jgi:hypothetical protein